MKKRYLLLPRRVTPILLLLAACSGEKPATFGGDTPSNVVRTAPAKPTPPRPQRGDPAPPHAVLERLERDRLELDSPLTFLGDGQLTSSARATLAPIARLLRERQDYLLIHIRVTRTCSNRRFERRAAMLAAEQRADAVLQYLWRVGRVSAERLEATGAAQEDCAQKDTAAAAPAVPWRTELWIQQRAREPRP